MNRIRVYIAGPYDGPDVITVLSNIRRGVDMASELMDFGFAPYCPFLDFQIAFTMRGPSLTKRDYQFTSMAFVECCHAMILLPGWEGSGGTKREIEEATRLNIPIFTDKFRLLDWHMNRPRVEVETVMMGTDLEV
jgi:hypothetical protein